MSRPNPAAPSLPAEPTTFTLTVEGMKPGHFAPRVPTIIGSKTTLTIELDRATGQAVLKQEPEGSLAPSQVISLLGGLLMHVGQLADHNERVLVEMQASTRSVGNGR